MGESPDHSFWDSIIIMYDETAFIFLIGVDSLKSANFLLSVRLLQSCVSICQPIKLLQERLNSLYVLYQEVERESLCPIRNVFGHVSNGV